MLFRNVGLPSTNYTAAYTTQCAFYKILESYISTQVGPFCKSSLKPYRKKRQHGSRICLYVSCYPVILNFYERHGAYSSPAEGIKGITCSEFLRMVDRVPGNA